MRADQIQQYLGRVTDTYWTNDPRITKYWGFNDPEYYLPSREIWELLCRTAPPLSVAPKTDVYDCEDIAMEFKTFVARTQVTAYPTINASFAIGIAGGRFSWKAEDHAVNFVVLNDSTIEWFDLALRRSFNFADLRPGLRWMIL
jgi:hypothetical protein